MGGTVKWCQDALFNGKWVPYVGYKVIYSCLMLSILTHIPMVDNYKLLKSTLITGKTIVCYLNNGVASYSMLNPLLNLVPDNVSLPLSNMLLKASYINGLS